MVAAICKRIAERSFRHGAELGIIEGHKFDRGLRGFDLVRPAPAEEKMIFAPPQYYAGCGWNRRLGERRKGREICPHAPEYPGRCFVFTRPDGTVYHAGDSRHKDRRKP
jgi:hypothetical protein